jgi:hypothetical protein
MDVKSPPMILTMVPTLLGAVIISTATAAGLAPSVIAQQQEETSLGEEEEDLADSIVSDVLDDHDVVDQDNTADQDDANVGLQDQGGTQEGESAQDAANTNVDSDVQVGEQSPLTEPLTRPDEPPTPTPPPPDDGEPPQVEPPEENGKIAFSSQRDGNAEIYIMNADGSEQTRLTNNPAAENFPSWSPDGTKIAFGSTRDEGFNWEIYIMNADGSEQTNITNNPAIDDTPDWGPATDTEP